YAGDTGVSSLRRGLGMVLRQHNSQNLLMCWAAPEFSLRRRGHSPLLMALGRGGSAMVVGIARIAPGPFLQLGPGASSLACGFSSWRPDCVAGHVRFELRN